MSHVLKVGIAGYGIVGKRRRHFIDLHPHLRTVAVCDQSFDGDGCFDDGVRYHRHYSGLLEEKLDLLFVCVPNSIAPEITIAGLERDMHIFCEKPPGRDVSDVLRVRNCEAKHPHLKLKYGFNHRYHDSIRDALAVIRSGELGKIVNMRGVYGKSTIIPFAGGWRAERKYAGGGILLDQGIHMVDLMRLFVGREFTQIHSFISNGFWNHDVEDNAYAMMKTDDGVVALLHSSATQWRHRFSLEIALQRGMLIMSGILSGSKSYGAEKLTVAYASENDAGDPREVTTRYNEDNSWRDEIASFAEAVLQDRPVVEGSSQEALETMRLVCRIYCADSKWRQTFGLTDEFGSDE